MFGIGWHDDDSILRCEIWQGDFRVQWGPGEFLKTFTDPITSIFIGWQEIEQVKIEKEEVLRQKDLDDVDGGLSFPHLANLFGPEIEILQKIPEIDQFW